MVTDTIVHLRATFDAGRVIDRACRSKHPFDTPGEARRVARQDSLRTGERIRAYRCPFGDGTSKVAHWHVGHVPSLEGLQDIARAIRESHQAAS